MCIYPRQMHLNFRETHSSQENFIRYCPLCTQESCPDLSGESESEVAQLCPTLCDPMDTRLLRPWDFLGKSTGVGCHFFLQGTSWPRDRTQVSHIVDRHFTVWATREVLQFSCSVVSDSLQPHGLQHARPPCPSPTPTVYLNSCPLSRWMLSSHLILLSPSPPTFNPSQHQGLFNESALRIRWTKDWNFSFNISPSNEHPELISFRMDWLDFLAIQGTLTSLIQHHSSKASILRRSALFIAQLAHPYVTTGKTIALTRRTFVDSI